MQEARLPEVSVLLTCSGQRVDIVRGGAKPGRIGKKGDPIEEEFLRVKRVPAADEKAPEAEK